MEPTPTTIYPLFSVPILFIEDTGYRLPPLVIDELHHEPLCSNPIYGQKNLSDDTYVLNRPYFEETRTLVENALQYYLREVACVSEDFYITNSWLTINKTGQSHYIHNHPNSLISGVLYLQADDANVSPIKFHNKCRIFDHHRFAFKVTNANLYNSPEYFFNIKTGSLVIFPSWLNHSVPPNQSNMTRITLGFNSFVSGNLPLDKNFHYCADLNL